MNNREARWNGFIASIISDLGSLNSLLSVARAASVDLSQRIEEHTYFNAERIATGMWLFLDKISADVDAILKSLEKGCHES